jgi:hypothetical protein
LQKRQGERIFSFELARYPIEAAKKNPTRRTPEWRFPLNRRKPYRETRSILTEFRYCLTFSSSPSDFQPGIEFDWRCIERDEAKELNPALKPILIVDDNCHLRQILRVALNSKL